VQTITAGDTLDFSVTVPSYSAADGWVLTYRLVPVETGDAITFPSVPDDDGTRHRLLVDAAVTAVWVAGIYSWASYVELDGVRHSISTGSTRILPDPAVAGVDLRTDAQIALAAAEAALAAWKPTMRSYSIGGRQMTFSSAADVLPIISYWKMAVQRENRAKAMAAGMADPRKLHVRLSRG
jgi:hypothetical protein